LTPRPHRDPEAVGHAAPIPLAVPEINGNEWNYVKQCLDTGWVSSVGAFVEKFEEDMTRVTGTRFGVATLSGTSALHVALLAAGIQPEDEVVVSTLTFIAPANAIRYVGAWPVFVDADEFTGQMDPSRLAEFLGERCTRVGDHLVNRESGRRVACVLPVHILGHPVDMDPVVALAREHGLAVIEDASESLGATYRGRPVGQLADAACFSFNGNKLITTGGGGMLVTDNEDLARKAYYLTTQAKDNPVEFVHRSIGYNYRMTNLLAAVGVAQLERLNEYVDRKRAIADRYAEGIREIPGLAMLGEASWARSSFWLAAVRITADTAGVDSRQLMRALQVEEIQTRPLWQPMHRSPAHAGASHVGGGVAEKLNRECLTLPCSIGISVEDQERVLEAIRRHATTQ
jgi:perosamine synthetase